jgi:hypothetical protein
VSLSSFSVVRSVSKIRTVPLVGRSRPARQCINVDLPEPDAPMTAWNRPAVNVMSTLSSAVTAASPLPYTLLRPMAWRAGTVVLPMVDDQHRRR